MKRDLFITACCILFIAILVLVVGVFGLEAVTITALSIILADRYVPGLYDTISNLEK